MTVFRSRKTTVRVVVGLAACAALSATQLPSAAATTTTAHTYPAPPAGCVVRDNLTEKAFIVKREDRVLPGTSSGDVATFRDDLYDATGKRVGVSKGTALMYFLPTDAQQMVEGHDYFGDGKVYVAGVVSLGAVFRGETITISATGVSGVYRGKVGVRTFTLVAQEADHNVYRSSLTVCPPPPASGQPTTK